MLYIVIIYLWKILKISNKNSSIFIIQLTVYNRNGIKIWKVSILVPSNFVLFVVGLYCKTISLCEDLHHKNLIVIMLIYVAQPQSSTYFSFYFVLYFKYGLISLQVLRHICYHILAAGLNVYMAIIANLKILVKKFLCGDAPITVWFSLFILSMHSFQM